MKGWAGCGACGGSGVIAAGSWTSPDGVTFAMARDCEERPSDEVLDAAVLVGQHPRWSIYELANALMRPIPGPIPRVAIHPVAPARGSPVPAGDPYVVGSAVTIHTRGTTMQDVIKAVERMAVGNPMRDLMNLAMDRRRACAGAMVRPSTNVAAVGLGAAAIDGTLAEAVGADAARRAWSLVICAVDEASDLAGFAAILGNLVVQNERAREEAKSRNDAFAMTALRSREAVFTEAAGIARDLDPAKPRRRRPHPGRVR